MARQAKEIQEQIDKLEAARKVTKARNGYAHYTDRINYLRGELALQKAHEARQRAPKTPEDFMHILSDEFDDHFAKLREAAK